MSHVLGLKVLCAKGPQSRWFPGEQLVKDTIEWMMIKPQTCNDHDDPPILAWPVPVTGDELHGGRL